MSIFLSSSVPIPRGAMAVIASSVRRRKASTVDRDRNDHCGLRASSSLVSRSSPPSTFASITRRKATVERGSSRRASVLAAIDFSINPICE